MIVCARSGVNGLKPKWDGAGYRGFIFMDKLLGKKLRVFDHASLHEGEYDTYTAIMSKISKNKGRLVCWDVRDPQTFDMVEFHKA